MEIGRYFEENKTDRFEKVQNAFLFAGLYSVDSVSAFPVNSRYCGQLFLRFPISSFHTNIKALQK